MSGCFLFIYATLFSFVTFLHQLTSVITEILPNAILISASCKLKLLNSVESYGIKGILMQILKSLKIFVFMWKILWKYRIVNPEDFQVFTRNVYENFVYKHAETIENVKK